MTDTEIDNIIDQEGIVVDDTTGHGDGTRWQSREKIRQFARRIEAAATAALPRTADGVPITPGMTLFFDPDDSFTAGITALKHVLDHWNSEVVGPVYSTREAAIRAGGAK